MGTLLLFVLGGVGVWLWFDGLRVREAAIAAAKKACQQYEVQFLDDTVALSGLGLGRNSRGQLRVRRIYQFEFSESGATRRPGLVLMLGIEHEALRMGLSDALH